MLVTVQRITRPEIESELYPAQPHHTHSWSDNRCSGVKASKTMQRGVWGSFHRRSCRKARTLAVVTTMTASIMEGTTQRNTEESSCLTKRVRWLHIGMSWQRVPSVAHSQLFRCSPSCQTTSKNKTKIPSRSFAFARRRRTQGACSSLPLLALLEQIGRLCIHHANRACSICVASYYIARAETSWRRSGL